MARRPSSFSSVFLNELHEPPPQTQLPCNPTLVVSVEVEELALDLQQTLRNDLVYANNSRFGRLFPHELTMRILDFLDGRSIVALTQAHGGTLLISTQDFYKSDGGKVMEALLSKTSSSATPTTTRRDGVAVEKLDTAAPKIKYQAVVTEMVSIVFCSRVRDLLQRTYRDGVNAVVLSKPGHLQSSPLEFSEAIRDVFPFVHWTPRGQRRCKLSLTGRGKDVLTSQRRRLPPVLEDGTKAVEALFIAGGTETSWSLIEAKTKKRDDPLSPNRQSAVTVQFERRRSNQSVAFCGLAPDGLDGAFGAIVLRLCSAGSFLCEEDATNLGGSEGLTTK